MKSRLTFAAWAAPLAAALVVGVAAGQQQTGSQNQQTQQNRQNTHQSQPDQQNQLENRQQQQQNQLRKPGDMWDPNQAGLYEVYHEHWVVRYNTPEYQQYLEEQRMKREADRTAAQRSQAPGQARANQMRNYDYFADTPTRWVNRHDGIFAWQKSDAYWRESDRFWRDPERRDEEGYEKYWDQSDDYWRDSDRYWEMYFEEQDRDRIPEDRTDD